MPFKENSFNNINKSSGSERARKKENFFKRFMSSPLLKRAVFVLLLAIASPSDMTKDDFNKDKNVDDEKKELFNDDENINDSSSESLDDEDYELATKTKHSMNKGETSTHNSIDSSSGK